MSNGIGIAVAFIHFKSIALFVYILNICPNNSQQTQELWIAIASQTLSMCRHVRTYVVSFFSKRNQGSLKLMASTKPDHVQSAMGAENFETHSPMYIICRIKQSYHVELIHTFLTIDIR